MLLTLVPEIPHDSQFDFYGDGFALLERRSECAGRTWLVGRVVSNKS